MKLADFKQDGDGVIDRVDFPLFRAMAAGAKELEVTPEEFVMCMRYAVMNHVYAQYGGIADNGESWSYPTILSMKITIV